MSDQENGQKNMFARAAQGVSLMIIARLSMIVAPPVLGLTGYLAYTIVTGFLSHMIASVESIAQKVDQTAELQRQTGESLRLLDQSIKLGVTARVEAHDKELVDHEGRLRDLERTARVVMPPQRTGRPRGPLSSLFPSAIR